MTAGPENIWERLGVEPTCDVRAIKRAYAKRLKEIRPDEDALAFQALREARDEALWSANFQFSYDDQAEVAGDDEDCRGGNSSDDTGMVFHFVENGDIDDLDVPRDLDHIEESGDPFDVNGFEEISVAIDIEACLASRLTSETIWQAKEWRSVVAEFEHWSIEEKSEAEYVILHAIGDHLPDLEDLSEERIFDVQSVLVQLNEIFNWQDYDRRLYDQLETSKARDVLNLIRAVKEPLKIRLKNSFYFPNGFPDLKEPEFELYLGYEKSPEFSFYRACLKAGQTWSLHWNWKAFFLPVFFLAGRHIECKANEWSISNLAIAVGVLYWAGLSLLIIGIMGQHWPYWLGGGGLLMALHGWMGCSGLKIAVRRMARNFSTISYLYQDYSQLNEDLPRGQILHMHLHEVGKITIGKSLRIFFLSLFLFPFAVWGFFLLVGFAVGVGKLFLV